jgi:hypothetical protein
MHRTYLRDWVPDGSRTTEGSYNTKFRSNGYYAERSSKKNLLFYGRKNKSWDALIKVWPCSQFLCDVTHVLSLASSRRRCRLPFPQRRQLPRSCGGGCSSESVFQCRGAYCATSRGRAQIRAALSTQRAAGAGLGFHSYRGTRATPDSLHLVGDTADFGEGTPVLQALF